MDNGSDEPPRWLETAIQDARRREESEHRRRMAFSSALWMAEQNLRREHEERLLATALIREMLEAFELEVSQENPVILKARRFLGLSAYMPELPASAPDAD